MIDLYKWMNTTEWIMGCGFDLGLLLEKMQLGKKWEKKGSC